MVTLITAILLTLVISFAKPVSIYIDYEGKRLKANAEWLVPEGTDPSKKGAILWLHGLFQTHSMQEPITVQREAWAGEGYAVLSPTLTLGVINRTKPYDCSYPLDHEYELNLKEIKKWIEWLKSKGIRKIVLAGHSMGGQQIIHIAETLKDGSIKGVLAVAPAKGTPKKHPLLKKAEKFVKEGRGRTLLQTNFFYCQKAKISARTLYSYYGVDRNIGKSLRRINIPVLIVWGGEDNRVKDLPAFLKPYIKEKKNIKIEVIDYADHFFRDLAAEDLTSISLEFFGEVLK